MTAVANDATSINVTWDEVPLSNQNGAITGYIAFYKEATATNYTSSATMHRSIHIRGLKAATQYTLRVLAYNNNGNGIASEMVVLSTTEMGKQMVNLHFLCPQNEINFPENIEVYITYRIYFP